MYMDLLGVCYAWITTYNHAIYFMVLLLFMLFSVQLVQLAAAVHRIVVIVILLYYGRCSGDFGTTFWKHFSGTKKITSGVSRNESPHHFRNCPQISVQPPPSTQAARAQRRAEAEGGMTHRGRISGHFGSKIYKNGVAERRDRSGLEHDDGHQNKSLKPAIKVVF